MSDNCGSSSATSNCCVVGNGPGKCVMTKGPFFSMLGGIFGTGFILFCIYYCHSQRKMRRRRELANANADEVVAPPQDEQQQQQQAQKGEDLDATDLETITTTPFLAPIIIKAKHPFSPTAPNQIAMAKDELFTLLDGTGNWWKVKSANGADGLVPSNYVENVAVEQSTLPAEPAPKPAPAPAPQPLPAASAPIIIKAKHPFSPTAPNQIAMAKDELFTLLDGTGNWWKVKSANGADGLVPSNYVEKVATQDTSAHTSSEA